MVAFSAADAAGMTHCRRRWYHLKPLLHQKNQHRRHERDLVGRDEDKGAEIAVGTPDVGSLVHTCCFS